MEADRFRVVTLDPGKAMHLFSRNSRRPAGQRIVNGFLLTCEDDGTLLLMPCANAVKLQLAPTLDGRGLRLATQPLPQYETRIEAKDLPGHAMGCALNKGGAECSRMPACTAVGSGV